MNYDDTICGRCGGDNLADYPVCRVCAVALHFPHRAICLHCETKRQPVLRVWEFWLTYADDVPLMADMLSELGVTI